MIALSMLLLMPVGCGSLGLEPTRHLSDSDAGPVTIVSVDPSFGPIDGGNAVTLTGTGFEGSITVSFGSAEVSASKLGETTIAVTAPDAGVEATVDLTVTTELGSVTLPGAYRFGSEPPDSGQDSGQDSGGDSSGETGDSGGESGVAGLLEFSLLQIACPSCFGLTSDLEVTADAAFHRPVSGSWVSWIPATGSCASSATATPPTSTFLDAGAYVHLQSGSHSLGLVRTTGASGPSYVASGLANDDYARTAFYGLDIDGGPDWSAEILDDAMLTPQGFSEITPAEVLYSDSRSAFTAQVSRNGQEFGWAPFGGTGTFLILIEAYDGTTGNPLGQGLCTGSDNGSMIVPSSVLGAWPRGSLLAIYFLRYQIEHPQFASGATLESVARVGVLGTGVIR